MSSVMGESRGASAEWTRRGERGSPFLIRFIVWLSVKVGRSAARPLLYPIVAYFMVAAVAARRASREYLTRCLGRAPSLREVYAHFFTFATTLHDRVFFLRGRFDLFDVRIEGADLLGPEGAILMGSHVGSFEAIRACAAHVQRRVAMAMYEDNARKVQRVLEGVNPAMGADVVTLGRLDSMLALHERLDAGAFVGVLADRTLGDDPAIEVDFLGVPAMFPTGPMRMAAALRQKVFFMAGLHRGGNRYAIRFEPLADFTAIDGLTRAERDALVREAVRRYAARMEACCRAAPYNFFNFYPFWRRP